MEYIRQPAAAGLFYPAARATLEAVVDSMLARAEGGPVPKAVIAPHAGYVYSGPVAAAAYARLAPAAATIRRVVLIGPSHRVPFRGIAATGAAGYATPLGRVAIDQEAVARLTDTGNARVLDEAHALEHSLEVHLPFLQYVLDDFTVIPVVVGHASDDQVARMLEQVWGGPETLVVVSSDLSHYHDYATAQYLDASTSAAIEALQPQRIRHEHACGHQPICGLLQLALQWRLQPETIDLRNSGDTAGPRNRVVGYGSYAIAAA